MMVDTYCFLQSSKDDGPSEAVQRAVGSGTWTEGGMAEAGWFLVGEMSGGGPIFSRTRQIKVRCSDG